MSHKFKDYRKESRTNWGTLASPPDKGISMDQINLGAVLRIADSLEEIAMSLKAMNMQPRTSEIMQARKVKRLQASNKKLKEQRDYYANKVPGNGIS